MLKEHWKSFLIIAVVAVVLYAPTLFYDFSYFDDNALIINNFHFLKNPANVLKAFQYDVFHVLHGPSAYYRPILTLSFMLDAAIGGSKPFIYHLTNLVLHACCALALFMFLLMLGYGRRLSLFGSLVFAVHPVLAQGVAWIPGRNDSLLCLFLLLSFLFFIRADSSGKKGYFVPHLAFFTLALFTKETALGLPLMVLFYVLFVRKGKLIFYLPVAAGWGMIMFLWSILRKAAFENNPLEMGAAIYAKSIAVNSPGIFLYLGKILLPVRMSVLPLLQDSSLLPGIFASILIALVFVSLKRERFRGAAFGLAWFVVFLLPSFIRPNTDLAADFMNHRIYLPFIGILLVVLEAGALRRFLESRKGLAVSGVVIAALAAAAFFHIRAFREGMSFWTNAVATSPHSPQAQMNLGAMHYLKGNNEAAEKGFREALKLNPREMMAHNNLGLIFMNRGMYAEAEREFAEELKINPFYDDGHFNLALLYYRAKRPDLAAAFWEKTLQINPDHFDAYTHLAVCAFLLGQREKTVLCINELQKRSPERIPALMENLKKLGYR